MNTNLIAPQAIDAHSGLLLTKSVVISKKGSHLVANLSIFLQQDRSLPL
jgi:hypothetical protein